MLDAAHHPVPRREGRARRQGRQLRRPARRRRSGRGRRALRRRRAPTSSRFLDITASHEERGIILDVVARTAETLLHAAHRRRRRAHDRGHPRAAQRGRRQGVDQHRRGRRARSSSRDAAERFGTQCIVVAIDAKRVRRRALGGVHARRAHADRARRGRVGARAWRRSARARSC